MKIVPYASTIGSLMYAIICTRPDIAFVVEMLDIYQNNPSMAHWKISKRVIRYLQEKILGSPITILIVWN